MRLHLGIFVGQGLAPAEKPETRNLFCLYAKLKITDKIAIQIFHVFTAAVLSAKHTVTTALRCRRM